MSAWFRGKDKSKFETQLHLNEMTVSLFSVVRISPRLNLGDDLIWGLWWEIKNNILQNNFHSLLFILEIESYSILYIVMSLF